MEGMEESRSFGKLKSLAQRPEPKHVHLDPCGPSFTHLDHSQPPSNSPLGSRRRRTMWGLIAKCTPIIESALVLLMLCGGWGSVIGYGTLYCRLHSVRSLKCQSTHIQHLVGWVSPTTYRSWILQKWELLARIPDSVPVHLEGLAVPIHLCVFQNLLLHFSLYQININSNMESRSPLIIGPGTQAQNWLIKSPRYIRNYQVLKFFSIHQSGFNLKEVIYCHPLLLYSAITHSVSVFSKQWV